MLACGPFLTQPEKKGRNIRGKERREREHLHCHKPSLSPSSADIFRHGIVSHYLPFMDRDKLSDREVLPHLQRFTPRPDSVRHILQSLTSSQDRYAREPPARLRYIIEDRASRLLRVPKNGTSFKKRRVGLKQRNEFLLLTCLSLFFFFLFCGSTAVVFAACSKPVELLMTFHRHRNREVNDPDIPVEGKTLEIESKTKAKAKSKQKHPESQSSPINQQTPHFSGLEPEPVGTTSCGSHAQMQQVFEFRLSANIYRCKVAISKVQHRVITAQLGVFISSRQSPFCNRGTRLGN